VFLEGLTRLLPNTHTDIHIVTRHGRVLVRARVVRALVWRLERDVVCYRTALAFDTAVDTEAPALSERSESNGYSVPVENPGISRPRAIATPTPRSKTVFERRNAAICVVGARTRMALTLVFGRRALCRVGGGGGGE
jgi:hypothetical protein